jgi:hypothetical protein
MTKDAKKGRAKRAKALGIPLHELYPGLPAEESTPVDAEFETPLTGVKNRMTQMANDLGLGKLSDKPLTAREADDLLPRMVTGVIMFGEGTDWFISRSNKAHAEATIWAMDEEDAEIIARVILLIGRKSSVGALAIRGVVQTVRFVDVGKITLPRAYQTIMFYVQHGGFGW